MSDSILSIQRFLGLNENPDGDTKIKNGELSEMRNFRITRDGHLQVRPGAKTVCNLRAAWDVWKAAAGHTPSTDAPVYSGAWSGFLGASFVILCAFGGVVFQLNKADWTAKAVGTCTQDDTTFFGFGGRVYLLNGHEYKSWDGTDGTEFADVVGYIPIIQTATNPAGKGTLLENVNRLNGLRRVKFSPDGTAAVFYLPEQAVDEVISVSGTAVTYTLDKNNGTLTFASAIPVGTNTVTVTYRKGTGSRTDVTGMRFLEFFNGENDTRVFLYGDGSNKAIYSGIDNDGIPTADYFPDLYEMAVGEENTPITAMVKHFSRLIIYKKGSTYSAQYGASTLSDGTTHPLFYVQPVNRILGNDAPGQVKIVENDPVSLDGNTVYQWKSTNTSGNLSTDERSARRVSDRVSDTLKSFDFSATETFNDKRNYEFWFLCGGTALIWNYANDTWFLYEQFPSAGLLDAEGVILSATMDGKIKEVSRKYRNDDGANIVCYAATGAMDFSMEYLRKYSTLVFVSLQPEDGARVIVSAESNRRSDYPDKVVAASLSTFSHVNFAHFSFNTNRKPQVRRLKLKVKKAAFYKLIFKSDSASSTATVLQVDVKFRYAGNVK